MHIEHICTFFVTFFSATIDDKDLIFGHKRHIGTPYRGKRFWTHQIVGKQEVGIWWVQKRFPRYGVPIWRLWPNIRSLSSIVAEKNVTKNVHICSIGGGGYTVLPLSVRPSLRPSNIFFGAFFSVTVDGRNLIFGHKHHSVFFMRSLVCKAIHRWHSYQAICGCQNRW
jgi:hypothetical protein